MTKADAWVGAAALTVLAGSVAAVPCAQDPGHCQLPDQLGHGSNNAIGAISDLNPNQPQGPLAAQGNFFTTADGVISSICFWGLYLDFDNGDCGPGGVPDAFTVTYYDNVLGFPGSPDTLRAGPFNVTATVTKAATGNVVSTVFGDLAEYEYTATHPAVPVNAGQCLWVEITNDSTGSDPTCVWLWSTAPSLAEGGVGDAVSWQGQFENDFDLAFCVDQPLGDPESCDFPIDPGCAGATNDCDSETSPDPGCADDECCTLVCLQLPFCCLVEWDQQCVDIAVEECGLCGEPGTGDCFAADFEPYCDDTCGGAPCIGCCQTVCNVDPACCENQFGWDGFCAFEAQQLCTCAAGSEPPNDNCQQAIPIGLGDTPIDNDCASPGGPSHATCNDGFLTGLGLDIWYTYSADFTGQLLVSTCGQINYDSQLAVYEGCDCGSLSDPPLACNNDGAVCPNGSSLLVAEVVAGNCYLIRVGSSFVSPSGSGTLTLSAEVPPICEITIPPEAIAEGEACGDNDNGGCDNEPAPPAFVPVGLGDVVHGTAWASGGFRDTDWYELVLTKTTEVTLTMEAEFPFVLGLAETIPPGTGDCADTTGFVEPSVAGATCEQASLTTTLGPGTWWPFAAPSIGDGVPCAEGVSPANDYVLTISQEIPCPGDCSDGDGMVGIGDFLAVIGQWGSIGTSCDMGLGLPGVGIEEFLQILGSWGPCP